LAESKIKTTTDIHTENKLSKLQEQQILLTNDSFNKKESNINNNIKPKLQRIFEYYTSFGQKLNLETLKSFNFHKFALEANLFDENFTKTRLELIYTTETKLSPKKQMDFKLF